MHIRLVNDLRLPGKEFHAKIKVGLKQFLFLNISFTLNIYASVATIHYYYNYNTYYYNYNYLIIMYFNPIYNNHVSCRTVAQIKVSIIKNYFYSEERESSWKMGSID